MASLLQALSYSAKLNLAHLAGRPGWSILSVHHHACNLVADDGTIVALVNAYHGNGPFHIVLPIDNFEQCTRQDSVVWSAQRLAVGPLVLAFDSAHPWDPQLPRLHHARDVLSHLPELRDMQLRSPLYGGPKPLVTRAQMGIAQLGQGIYQRSKQLVVEGVSLLAGLGPGLTPAGDDFLVGFLVALHALSVQCDTCNHYSNLISTEASRHTTKLSGAWLHYAGQGCVGELWHHLIDALNGGHPAAIRHTVSVLTAIGATSGVDAFCGFLRGYRWLYAL